MKRNRKNLNKNLNKRKYFKNTSTCKYMTYNRFKTC